MSEQLSVPLKKSGEVSLEESLKSFLGPYLPSPGGEIEKAVKELDKLRREVVSKKPPKTTFALDQLFKYHDQLVTLENLFPSETLIPFTWDDAFSKASVFSGKISLALSFMGYEKHCVLFNIAALQSQLGIESSSVDTDDDRKNAAKYFQSASGIFEYLKPSEVAGDNLTPDFHPDMLASLSAIMLAQAQEMFVTKAIRDHMKDGIIAKLCIQTEEMFADVLLKMTRDAVKYNWDRSWLQNIKGKKFAYYGLANYFQSKVCGEKKMIGEQITRLNVAIENMKTGQDKTGSSNFHSYFMSEAKRFLAAAIKDNDFIYHEVVPTPAKLAAIPKVATAKLAKVTPVPTKFDLDFKNPFEDMKIVETPKPTVVESEPVPVSEPNVGWNIPLIAEATPEPVVSPVAPPRKKKSEENGKGDATDSRSDSPATEPEPVNEPAFTKTKAVRAPTWSQVMNDSWSLIKPYFEEAVLGKK
ncbi:unnamed protein product [Allacma fusca]|uniref:BRO1 domain-containing protein n=1 Tax=Allacma fusca TaxID=39272 RepID=A0A8J2LSU5_9HEXA|nr:unnamed protein product [Allacma fusca]